MIKDMNIIPAILPKSYEELLDKFERVKDFHNLIQLDLVDGVVGEEKTWMPNFKDDLSHFPEHEFQFDLMLENWKSTSYGLVSLMKVHSFVFHIDSCSDEEIVSVSNWCEENSIRCGFSISSDTGTDLLVNALNLVREKNHIFVQVMGIQRIGVQGQAFDERCLSRIRKIRENFGTIFIQVDGAMKPETIQRIKAAGADAAVVGSYLFGREDIFACLEELSSL